MIPPDDSAAPFNVQVMGPSDVTDAHATAEGEGHRNVCQVVCYTFQLDRRYPVTMPAPWTVR